MSRNPGLDKVLLSMDLSAGLNENVRPEVGGDQVKTVITLDNLIQDQSGAWVKRSGLTYLGSGEDDLGSDIGTPLELFRTTDGLGLISNIGNVYHWGEAFTAYRARTGRASEFTITGQIVASSGVTAENPTYGQKIICSASSTKYDVIVYEGGPKSTYYETVMVVIDRASGCQLAKYDLSTLIAPASGNVLNARAIFVQDRYLHIALHDTDSGSAQLDFAQWDSNSAWPASVSSFTHHANVLSDTAIGSLNDLIFFNDRSIVCTGSGTSSNYIASFNTAGTLIESYDTTTELMHPISADVDPVGVLYVGGSNFISGHSAKSTFPYNNLSGGPTTNHNDAAAAGNGLICIDGSNIVDVEASTYTTLGSVTWDTMKIYTGTATADYTLLATLYGWIPLSTPFRIPSTGKVYVHVCKHDPSSTLSTHALLCISDLISVDQIAAAGGTTSYKTCRVAACIEPFLGVQTNIAHRIFVRADDSFTIAVPLQTTARATSVGVLSFTTLQGDTYGSGNFGLSTYIGGGYITEYDGWNPCENGFVDLPVAKVADKGSGSGGPNGSYEYVSVFKHINSKGEISFSRTFGPMAITVSNHTVSMEVQTPQVTNKETGVIGDQHIVTEVYRTVSGGTVYHLVASSQANLASSTTPHVVQLKLTTNKVWAADDIISDSDLAGNPEMHRQPGTDNSPLDRFCFPSCKFIKPHKDRLVTCDPYGAQVFYSSFFVDGECAWTNPDFALQVHGGSGPITALASMDGRLIIFKRDAIFMVDGDGPPENGGNGTEFSQPQRIPGQFGCVDFRSVITIPEGIVYRSSRGFELLDRSLAVQFIGENAKITSQSNPDTYGVALESDGTSSRLRFIVGSEFGTIEMVYDLGNKSWSTSSFNTNLTSITSADIGIDPTDTVIYADALRTFRLDPRTSLDTETDYVSWTFETGDIRPMGAQGRHRFHCASILGQKWDDHSLTASLSFNYEDSYIQSTTWEPDVLTGDPGTPEEVTINASIGLPISFRLRVVEDRPADMETYPATTGEGMDLLGITFEVSAKRNAFQVAAEKKG